MNKLLELFLNKTFVIPKYQRGYAWEIKHCSDLWNDLTSINNGNHYTGMVTLKPNKNNFELVDGQQRIITCMILNLVFIKYFQKNGYVNVNIGLEKEIVLNDLYQKMEHLIVNEISNYNDCFRNILFNDSKIKYIEDSYTQNVKKTYSFYEEKMKKHFSVGGIESLQKLYSNFLNKIVFNVWSIENMNVHDIFDSMNTRGKDLSKLENLKNKLMTLVRLIESDPIEIISIDKEISEKWMIIYQYLGKTPLLR